MFKISTKGDYGLLLLSALAQRLNCGKKYVSLKEIAQAKNLSLSYISQIILPLKKAGLVTSKEGRDGGYSLSKPANKISIMEILEALEGPLMPTRCCSDKSAKCGNEALCNLKFTWRAAKSMLADFLSAKTLADTLCPPGGCSTLRPFDELTAGEAQGDICSK
ncbi:Rrf2 family transcriptional regulator [Candidatus Peregrinibacteria bacterium]|nr:Rrf2 family transcriptional regulator [Candidatus Peregrinibacteria bacterium]